MNMRNVRVDSDTDMHILILLTVNFFFNITDTLIPIFSTTCKLSRCTMHMTHDIQCSTYLLVLTCA